MLDDSTYDIRVKVDFERTLGARSAPAQEVEDAVHFLKAIATASFDLTHAFDAASLHEIQARSDKCWYFQARNRFLCPFSSFALLLQGSARFDLNAGWHCLSLESLMVFLQFILYRPHLRPYSCETRGHVQLLTMITLS